MWERTRLRLPGARGEVWTETRTARRRPRQLRARRRLAGANRIARQARARCGRSCARAPAGGWRRCAPTGRASTCGPESGPTSRWSATSGSASAAGRSRRAGWRTSRPATTRATRSGAGPPASAAPRRALGRLEPGQRHQRPAGALRAGDLGGRRALRARSGRASRAWTRSPSTTEPGSSSAASASGEASENFLVVRYTYRQPFGSFSGTLPGGLELERGLGVMEHHDAHW